MERDSTKLREETGKVPLVSIIVPSYNHADYIRDCVLSILEQEYPCIEPIVVNDGSTDRTDEVMQGILKEYPARVRYISKSNEGLVKTLNLGLQTAAGTYFCELASDDMLLPGSIARRVAWLEGHPDFDAVFADGYLMKGDEKTRERANQGKPRYSSTSHSPGDLITGKARIFFPSGMFKKAILEKLGGFDEDFRYFEDLAMQFPLAMNARIGYLDEPVMYYRRHGENISARQKGQVRREKILALEKVLGSAGDALKETVRRQLYREYLKLLQYASANTVEREELMRAYRSSLGLRFPALKARYYMLRLRMKGAV